jgi:ferrous iron transport protein B
VTVEKVSGAVQLPSGTYEVLDIPGLYSLRALSADEKVALSNLAGANAPEAMIFVADAVGLERSLFLLSQAAELGVPMVVALTMTDLARKEGHQLTGNQLEAALGVPVVEVLAHRGDGLEELKSAVSRAAVPRVALDWSAAILREAEALAGEEGDVELAARTLVSDEPGSPGVEAARERLRKGVISLQVLDTQARYAWAGRLVKELARGGRGPSAMARKADAILTHKVFGLVIFAGIMYGVFLSIYTFASPLMDLIEGAFGWLGGTAGPWFAFNPALKSLVVDGIIGGVGGAVVFLPQILILFFFIAVLEGSGYLARASFLMDKLFGWCGLSGRAFIPLLSSFACAIPGIMAARVMPDHKSRIITIMAAPLMSCSARLPVYVLIIGVFIEPKFGPYWAGFCLLAMHLIGAIVAIPLVLLLNQKGIKGSRLPFVMDMPRYQWPKLRDVWITVGSRAVVFLKTAGTVIVAMSIIIWGTLYFPRSEERMASYRQQHAALPASQRESVSEDNYVEQQQRRDSYLGQAGRALEPVFLPAGFDWRMTTAILAAFPAREVVVSAMGVLFSVGGDADEGSEDLRTALAKATWPDGTPLITIWNAVGLMVFFALCMQCMSTLAVMRRETGSWKWPLAAFGGFTLLAYLAAVLIYQVGRLVGG